MKTSTVGLVFGAILMVVAGVGFGIAQAGDYNTDPMFSFEDQQAFEQSIVSNPSTGVLPNGIDLSFEADGNPSTDMADLAEVTHSREAVETGSLPDEMSNADFDPFSRGGL